MTLRRRFPDFLFVVATVTGDWQPGYPPPANSYGDGTYQDVIAAVGPEALKFESVTWRISLVYV